MPPDKRQLAGRTRWNETRPAGEADFYTVGYSGREDTEVVALLRQHGVRTLVDIRHNVVSLHRPEMSKARFSALLEQNGIGYVHRPDLGVPPRIRKAADSAKNHAAIWEWYDRHLAESFPNLPALLAGIEQPAAFLCLEFDPHECHRHRLALALEHAGLFSHDI